MNSLCEREKKMRKLYYIRVFYGNRILATFIEWTEDNCGQCIVLLLLRKYLTGKEIISEILSVCGNVSQ